MAGVRIWRDDEVGFRPAVVEDLGEVLNVLDEAAGWLDARGVAQWPKRFEASWVEGAIGRGETWLVEAGGRSRPATKVDGQYGWTVSPRTAAFVPTTRQPDSSTAVTSRYGAPQANGWTTES